MDSSSGHPPTGPGSSAVGTEAVPSSPIRVTIPDAGHTPGPWRWEVNHKSKQMDLCGGARPKFDLTVMDCVRWGMGGAAFRFIDARNIMHRADGLTVPVAGREHHASWFQTINHPDAILIAAAPDLLAEVDWYADQLCEGWCEGAAEWAGFSDCAGCRARCSAARARGLPAASGIEAATAGETGTGSTEGESPAPQGETPNAL